MRLAPVRCHWLRRAVRPAGRRLVGVLCAAGLAWTTGCSDTAAAPPDEQAFETARRHAVGLQDGGKDTRETLDALLAAHALNPGHYGINHRLGRLYSEQKLHDQALDHFQRAYRAKPDDLDTLLAIVTLQVRFGLLDEALANLPPIEQDQHLRGEALYQRATILDQRGQRDAALAIVSGVADLRASEAYRCRSLHGRFRAESGDFPGAQQEFRAALDGRADYKEALKGMADSCRRLGQDAEADRWDNVLGNFIELTDNVYMATPRARPERRAVLEKLLAAYPDWSAGFQELAELQVAQGDRAAACRTIEAYLAAHAAETTPDSAAALRQHYCDGRP